jgi:glutaredoxin
MVEVDDEIEDSMPIGHEKPLHAGQGGALSDGHKKDADTEHASQKAEHNKDDGEEMAREELQTILKKSPIVIFSKSYCPYSKKAKALLLETYTITPTPYVVELDMMSQKLPKPPQQHVGDDERDDDDTPAPTMGRKLQDLLATLTGRRTVPNIMINAQSLGGGDDVARMHAEGTLEEEIKKLGGKRIVSIDKTHSTHG